jgi:hypothetical protein
MSPAAAFISTASIKITWDGFSLRIVPVKFSGTIPPSITTTSSAFLVILENLLANNGPKPSSPRNSFPIVRITSF